MSDDSIEYFVYHDDEIQGPLTRSQLKRLLRKGGITGETLCAVDGGTQWAPVSALFNAKAPAETPAAPVEGRIAYGAAISMFFGFLGVLCLGGVVLKQEWGFWLVAVAALVALASGVFTILRGRNREPGPHDSPLALGGIAAGCIALMAGTWLPSALLASEPKPAEEPAGKAPEIQKDNPATQVPATLVPPNGGIIDTGGTGTPNGIIDTGAPATPPDPIAVTPPTPIAPITPPAPVTPPNRPLPGPGGVQPFPAPPPPTAIP